LLWSAIRVENRTTDKPGTLHSRIVSGSFVLLVGSGVATATNLLYNIAVARFLGPAGFGHATAVYTLLILISAATLSIQIVSAKMVARQATPEGKRAVYHLFHRAAWVVGIAVGLALLIFARPIANFLNLPSPSLVALLSVGAAFYVPLGSRRGYVQGACAFRSLAISLIIEGVGRLGGSLLLMRLGLGVPGVIAANSAAVALAWLLLIPQRGPVLRDARLVREAWRETSQALVFFAGQVLISNWNIVLVKHFFAPRGAGLYAAVAMVGRVIFTSSWAVVNSMFPLVAGTRAEDRRGSRLMLTSLLLVLGVGGVIVLGLHLAPPWIWTAFFGKGFFLTGRYDLSYLMEIYAIMTVIYCLSVVLITYEMSYRIANTSWLQLAFSGVLIAGVLLFHASLHQVIWVQLAVMIALLVVVAVPFVIQGFRPGVPAGASAPLRSLRILRRVSEDEVIAAFLRGEINNPAFHSYKHTLYDIIVSPNCDDPMENAKRRALLFIRHFSLWKELPHGTEWYELQLRVEDLAQIRAFPRAQWRRLARGDFSITRIAARVRELSSVHEPRFQAKIAALRDRLLDGEPGLGTVILIGLNENQPLTILDGNHRLLATLLTSPDQVTNLRVLCGLSPRMSTCCWYNTNLFTLFRYGKNIVTHVANDPEAELARLLQSAG